jgi:WD40 repeat protein
MALHQGCGVLATGSRGIHGATNVKFWEVHPDAERPGTCLATVAQLPLKQGGSLGSLCFARDGTTLFSGASDGSVAAWKLGLKEDGGGDAEQGANRGGGGSRSGSSSFGKSGALMKGGFLKAL